MFKKIRELLQDTIQPESGDFEADECYIGGRRHGKRGRGAEGKMPIFGITQRDGEVSATKVNDLKSSTVYPLIKERVLPQSMIYTDEFSIYDNLQKQGYHHKRVHHASRVWVMGDAHTNNIEGFWSVLKRGINGVYHAVSEKYLQNYIDEYAFRYNHRKDERPMFLTILAKV